MKPRIAEKAQEEGGTPQRRSAPVPQADLYAPLIPRKKDNQQAARLGAAPQDGEGNGVYSKFLADWAKSIQDYYNAAPVHYPCIPALLVGFERGHPTFVEPDGPQASCGGAADEAMIAAVRNAQRPSTPVGFGSDQLEFIFYQRDEGPKPR